MTYKEGISRFLLRYKYACLSQGLKQVKLSDKEALMFLSEPYADICNQEKLITSLATVDLIASQYEYSTGTGASNIPANLLDVFKVTLNDSQFTKLEKVSGFGDLNRISGQPTQYTILYTNNNRVLQIDSLPDAYSTDTDNRLNVHYCKKIFTYSGSAENSFSDLDFTSSSYGGSFLNPTEWDNVIIEGTIANLIPQRYQIYKNLLENAKQKMTIYTSGDIPAFAGSEINVIAEETGRDPERPI